ncbi:MAG: GNAT family N-acetyltransferase, partial [Planctomycetes bacterium]|nr:GNAT family N-acetyltransferase [Planctomycetota bacterium]
MLHIRSFRPDDLPVLKAITVDAFDGVSIDQGIERLYGPVAGHDWKWRKARHLDDDVRREPQGIFVAEDDGRVVGCITTWHDAEAGMGHIPNLALRPEYRGRGLGRRLIEHAMGHFRTLGVTHARIETLEQNA